MATINKKIAVTIDNDSMLTKAKSLALHLHLPLVNHQKISPHFLFLLVVTPDHLELRENTSKPTKPIWVDFMSSKLNYRMQHGGGKKQLIAKAIGIKNKKGLKVLDATAGFGIDAFVLASLGCEVVMLERSPIIAALLEDGLTKLKKNLKTSRLKITLHQTEAISYFKKIIQGKLKKPDVIYLDPMYPKQKKSALNKKKMRILFELVGADADADKLLKLALQCAKNRVVVKRPKQAESLNLLKPDLQFSAGGSSRYDVYFVRNFGRIGFSTL